LGGILILLHADVNRGDIKLVAYCFELVTLNAVVNQGFPFPTTKQLVEAFSSLEML
jgi:hypothetical protein